MTIQQVMDALCNVMHAQFPQTTIYTEKIAQGFKRPCFFLEAELSEKPLMTPRFEQIFQINIQGYMPMKTNNVREVMNEISEQLLDALAWVGFGAYLKQMESIKLDFKNDDYFSLSGEYHFHILRQQATDKMKTLKQNLHV